MHVYEDKYLSHILNMRDENSFEKIHKTLKITSETEMPLLAYRHGSNGGHKDQCPDGFSTTSGTGKYSPGYMEGCRLT